MPYVPKFQNHLASYACITVSGLIFLRDSHCSLQTKRREFLPCYSYISESLIGWVFNQLKSLTDRSRFFHKIGVGGGEGYGGPNQMRNSLGGGEVSHNGKFSWRSAGQKRNLQIWNLQRLASMGSDIQEDIYNLIQCWNN